MFNIFLFVPFGIIVSLHFPSRFRKKLWPIVATLLLACLLSCFIEFAQLFVRNRHSSLTDIISNTTGGLAGGLIVRFWPGSFGGYLASLIGWKWAWSAILALTLLLAWAPASIPVVFPNWYLPGLWATDATLNAGNNPSLTRPWYGSLHRVAIYSQALDPEHARECFWTLKDGKPPSPQADDKLEALYEFDESRATALLDRSGRGSDLHLEGTGRFRWRPKHGGVQLRHPARLSTGPVSGKRISSSLLNSHEFSLEAWITPRNLFQRGPATILALAGPGDSSNVLLGQSTKDLVFWVRTPVSGLGLTTLSVTTTNQPLGRRLTHVIAVFREGQLELFVNGIRSGRLNLKRDALIGLPARRTSGAKAAYAFFYFFPFALLWSARFGRKTGRTDAGGSFFSVLSPWLPGLAAMGLLILGESIQAGSAGRSFDLPFVGLGILVIAVATVVGRISSTARQPE